MKTKSILASLILAASAALAGPEAMLSSGLIHPDIIQQIKGELQLSADQEARMSAILIEARAKGEPAEAEAKEQQRALNELLRQPGTTADAASAQLAKTLECEAAVKQLQLRSLIALRDVLTPEQQKKALTLSAPKAAAKSDIEARVSTKAGKLRAAVEALGEKPTEAMQFRGGEIEKMIKAGDWLSADAALDKLIADSGADEPADDSPAPDFSKFDAGDTDPDALKARFESVKERAQEIISIPLMRKFLKAKDAFDAAKAAEDAAAVGRIMTWAEEQLKDK